VEICYVMKKFRIVFCKNFTQKSHEGFSIGPVRGKVIYLIFRNFWADPNEKIFFFLYFLRSYSGFWERIFRKKIHEFLRTSKIFSHLMKSQWFFQVLRCPWGSQVLFQNLFSDNRLGGWHNNASTDRCNCTIPIIQLGFVFYGKMQLRPKWLVSIPPEMSKLGIFKIFKNLMDPRQNFILFFFTVKIHTFYQCIFVD